MTQLHPVVLALIGTGFPFFMTSLGAAVVFFFRGEIKPIYQKIFLGFAAGVMIAASVWSLLIPAFEHAEQQGKIGWIPMAGGFIIGGLFLFVLDKLLPHFHPLSNEKEGLPAPIKRTTMLVFAVTLHNIPEGMAVGLAFAVAATYGDASVITLAGAFALSLGIGLQNLPEGAAISLPLRQQGLSRKRSFTYGALSGAVEPIAGVLTVLIAGTILPLMPWLLAFAAGAMIYVTVEELIPEANLGDHSNAGTLSVMFGFVLMMVLDIVFG